MVDALHTIVHEVDLTLAVKDGSAALTIPADSKPGALVVRDSASATEVEIDVAEAPAGK